MPTKITYEEIRRTIWKQRQEIIESYITEGRSFLPYKFTNFQKDMDLSELTVDKQIQKGKWKSLCDRGFITRQTINDQELDGIDLKWFSDLMSSSVRKQYEYVISLRDREIERDTHTFAQGRAHAHAGGVQ